MGQNLEINQLDSSQSKSSSIRNPEKVNLEFSDQITVGGWPVLESSAEILSEHFGQSVVEVSDPSLPDHFTPFLPLPRQITSFVLVIAYFLSSLTGLFFIERSIRLKFLPSENSP